MRKVITREGFLSLIVGSFGALAGLALGIPILGNVLSPLLNTPKNVWRDVMLAEPVLGQDHFVRVETIPLGQTHKVVYRNATALAWAGATGKSASWLRRTGPESFIAFSINCTHLGCPVDYLQGGHLFLCPCHGSVFNDDGTVAGGPAARPLTRYPVRVKHGRVQIMTEPLPLVF